MGLNLSITENKSERGDDTLKKKWKIIISEATVLLSCAVILLSFWIHARTADPAKSVAENQDAENGSAPYFDDAPLNSAVATEASWAVSYHSLKEMSDSAALIFIGTVKNTEPADSDHVKLQLATVQVDWVLKGAAPSDMVKVQETGGYDETGQEESIDGVPLLKEGDKVLLICKVSENGIYYPTGANAGKFFYQDKDTLVFSGSLAWEEDGLSQNSMPIDEFSQSDFQKALQSIQSNSTPDSVRQLKTALDQAQSGGKQTTKEPQQAQAALNTKLEKIDGLQSGDLAADLKTLEERNETRSVVTLSESAFLALLAKT